MVNPEGGNENWKKNYIPDQNFAADSEGQKPLRPIMPKANWYMFVLQNGIPTVARLFQSFLC